jgi:hypothetical protein
MLYWLSDVEAKEAKELENCRGASRPGK